MKPEKHKRGVLRGRGDRRKCRPEAATIFKSGDSDLLPSLSLSQVCSPLRLSFHHTAVLAA